MRVGDNVLRSLDTTDGVVETGLCIGPPEKKLHSLRVALSGTLSPVRFRGGNRRMSISRNIGGNAA
jgi:hypothetical protein